jgi:hypothetical protein
MELEGAGMELEGAGMELDGTNCSLFINAIGLVSCY